MSLCEGLIQLQGFADCAGKTRRETEEYIVAFRPKPFSSRPYASARTLDESDTRGAIIIIIIIIITSNSTRGEAEELPDHIAASRAGDLQFSLLGQP